MPQKDTGDGEAKDSFGAPGDSVFASSSVAFMLGNLRGAEREETRLDDGP